MATTSDTTQSLNDVLVRIKDPHQWTDPEYLMQILRDRPSARGLVYGFVAEVQFAHWLDARDIPLHTHVVDDDHAKTKSDRTIPYRGKRYTIQVKSMQTEKIKQVGDGRFAAKVQCDASDKREVILPGGRKVKTTCYLAGEFMVLATTLHPFTGEWDFAFRLNSTLEHSTYYRYSEAERRHLLKTTVDISWPLEEPWTTDLFGLLEESPDLGEVLDPGDEDEPAQIRLPGTDEIAEIEG